MRHVQLRSVVAAMVAVAVAAPAAVGAELRYTAAELGSVGGVPAGGRVLNGLGDVGGRVVLPRPGGIAVSHPVLSLSGGEMEDLGLAEGATGGAVAGLNDRRQAVIAYDFPGGVMRPYLFSGGGPPQPIALPAGFTRGVASGINNLGHVSGTLSSTAIGGPAPRPFVYADGVTSVLALPAGAVSGTALDINDRGDVLGTYRVPAGGGFTTHAAVWSGGTVTEVAPPEGWNALTPLEINAPGHVLGYVHRVVPGSGLEVKQPFLYRDGELTVLGEPLFTVNATVNGMNDRDEFVGAALLGLTTRGYLYSNGAYSDLTTAALLPDGFRIVSAADVNNAGQILVTALNPAGQSRSFVLTPVPEPGAAACAFAAGAWALLARRRAAGR